MTATGQTGHYTGINTGINNSVGTFGPHYKDYSNYLTNENIQIETGE